MTTSLVIIPYYNREAVAKVEGMVVIDVRDVEYWKKCERF